MAVVNAFLAGLCLAALSIAAKDREVGWLFFFAFMLLVNVVAVVLNLGAA